VEVLVILFVVVLLLGLLLPMLDGMRETGGYRNQCQGRIKQIGLALLNYEQSNGRLPLISQLRKSQGLAAQTCKPGTAGGTDKLSDTSNGWSWIVKILPYLEEGNLYKSIAKESNVTLPGDHTTTAFSIPPFSPRIVNGTVAYQHASCVFLQAMICPSWAGNRNTSEYTTVDVTLAPEYADVGATSMPPPGDFKNIPAPTNYKAVVGTHIADGVPVEDGAMLLTADNGSTLKSISDGTGKTLLVAETKECGYASWYDGTLNWIVTNDPNAASPPGTDGKPPWTGAQLAIPASRTWDQNSVPYLKRTNTKNSPLGDVRWGPSSDHSNGQVMHVFCDDHVEAITNLCDPQVYLNLTTRAGGEEAKLESIR